MCEHKPSMDREPERTLAALFKSELNVDINPQALRMFVRGKWSRLTVLAHAIHADEPAPRS